MADRAMLQVNYFYFYCVDEDFGPFFIKFCSYFPYSAKLCLNANHWAQRQAQKAGIGVTPMDNAFAAVDDVPALQAICDSFGEEHIRALLEKWLRILPYPFTEGDTAAGYRYDVSVVQAEFSLTQMLDRPVTGRIFLEQMIRDNLDLGRPDKISLIFGRRIHNGRKRPTRSQFRTRIVTDNVTPAVRVEYKHSKVCTHLAPLLGRHYEDMTSGQITYDLRRLRVHGLIERIPRTHRYQATETGLRHALFLTRLHARFLRPGLAELTGQPPPLPAPLRAADRAYHNAIDHLARQAGLAA